MAVLQSDGVNHTSDLILRRNGTEGLRLTSSTVQLSSINDGPLGGFRNLLINGNFLINQRGYVSGTNTTSANQYTLDRWRVVTSGQNITFSTTNNLTTVTVPAGGFEQVVEDISIKSGTYVLNWTGTATATVNGTARAKGATFSLTGGSNCTVRFSSGTVSEPQLELSTVPTPFEQRPIGTELALCQRYFVAVACSTSGSDGFLSHRVANSANNSGTETNWYADIGLQYQMRIENPTVSTDVGGTNPFTFRFRSGASSSVGTISGTRVSKGIFLLIPSTAQDPSAVTQIRGVSSNLMYINAEL